MKPLSVTLPLAARFTGWEDSGAVRGSAFETQAKAKTVTVAEGQEGAAGAVFEVATIIGPVSNQ